MFFFVPQNKILIRVASEGYSSPSFIFCQRLFYTKDYNKYYPQHKQNLPATKYLDLGTDFFWWLEKNKDNSIEEKVDMLYKMVQEDNYTESYEDMRHRKLKLDTKGLIPTEL